MESNIRKIKKGEFNLSSLLNETEKVTVYNELEGKDALSLRLLTEELINMLSAIVSDFDGEFWIVNNGSAYELCAKIFVENIDIETRERLIKVSKSNKNSSAVGITGKIRAVFDYMAMGANDPMISPAGHYGFSSTIDFSQIWSLREYHNSIQNDNKSENEEWDEFERSIIVKVADDVLVGIKGKTVNIIVKKDFAKK